MTEGLRPSRVGSQATGRAQAARSRIVRWVETLARSSPAILFFRTIGALAIALVACLVPEVGPNRFLLAGVLVGVCIPAAIWVERHHPSSETSWSQLLFDLVAVVTLVHLVPHMWFPALVIGLMIVQAPSVAEATASHTFYGVFALVLVVGMSLAAIVHDVPGWELPILAMTVLYPSVIFYSYRQSLRSSELSRRARALEGLQLIAGGVAHDFNNLLTPIVSYTELMLGRAEAGSREQRYLAQIRKAAERATELVRQILAFSRTRQAAVGAADVCACVDEVLDLLRPTLPSTIELLRQCDLPDAYVLADSHEIVQVIMNLCTNAYQAIGEAPGRIIVRVERVPGAALAPPVAATDSASPPEWVRLTVQDSGDGIDPEAREHLFEPFFTTKGAGKGTGLGLPVVYGIVRKLGGRIDFESAPGRGTSFIVELPAMVGTPQAGGEGSATDERGQGEHILLVDDDAGTLEADRKSVV